MKIVKGEYTEKKNKAGRLQTAYIVHGIAGSDTAVKAVNELRKDNKPLKAWLGFVDKRDNVFQDEQPDTKPVWVVERANK